MHKKLLHILKREKREFSEVDDQPVLEKIRHLLRFFRFNSKQYLFLHYNSLHSVVTIVLKNHFATNDFLLDINGELLVELLLVC